MEVQRKQYTPQFKQEAVRLINEGSLSLSQVAQQLGVNRNLLTKWRRHLAAAHEAQAAGRSGYEAFPGQGRAHDEEVASAQRAPGGVKSQP